MKILLKIYIMLITSIVSFYIWRCTGLVSCSAVVFKIASSLILVIVAAVMLAGAVTNGVILFLLAFLVSHIGILMLVVKLFGEVNILAAMMKEILITKPR